MSEVVAEVFYSQGGESFFRPAVIEVDDDAAEVEDDVFYPLHFEIS
jgi:hypothetical protein